MEKIIEIIGTALVDVVVEFVKNMEGNKMGLFSVIGAAVTEVVVIVKIIIKS